MALKPIKWYKNLSSRKGREEAGVFAIEGKKSLKQITENHPNDIIEIITVNSSKGSFVNFPIRVVTEQQYSSISSTKTPQGTMAIVQMPEGTNTGELPAIVGSKVIVLEDIQDPGNIGTIIRTAVAFGFDGAILSGKCADPFSPKCTQSTAGTVLSLWIRRTNDYLKLLDKLKHEGFSVAVADVDGKKDVEILNSTHPIALGLCNESAGPSNDLVKLANYIVGVPIDRTKAESLNVAICGAICMYSISLGYQESTADR